MLLGSEGILGVITEAWVRVQERPRFRSSASVGYESFPSGAEAVRALSQSGLHPSNCRLLDAKEVELTSASDRAEALLIVGFESADHPVSHWMDRALELAGDHGGELRSRADKGERGTGADGGGSDPVGAWRQAFLRAPYIRDLFVRMGILSDTFETAITWDRFPQFHAALMTATEDAARRVCGEARVSCRFTHVYPDGPAPYFTIVAPARRGSEVEQWDEIKAAASDAVIAAGGTITHHHAVGRDHRPWYDRQRPDRFAAALRGAKAAVDPGGLMNPGVLIAPERIAMRSDR
jgi:alkyldihydroxyacetonephosphate synthase